jgi:hypothetical protein
MKYKFTEVGECLAELQLNVREKCRRKVKEKHLQ